MTKRTNKTRKCAYATSLGRAYQGDALAVLPQLAAGSVALVLTSPPFALIRQKAFPNPPADAYAEWFLPFADAIYRVLRPDGSFVFELGNGWNRGGTRSLYAYDLVLRLGLRGWHLAQEFYWYNPSKLPTPAEWVTIRRTRVKDAVTTLWWFAKSKEPQADNRRVLKPYSKSMQRLLKNGYRRLKGPSGHFGDPGQFDRSNGGSIPSNLIQAANTRSNEPYLHRCRAAGLTPHPARFVAEVPDFFIRLLTAPGQLVCDPFAGSNTVGATAEALGRQWIAIERDREYVAGSRLRFDPAGNKI